jgi:hypothetical protein
VLAEQCKESNIRKDQIGEWSSFLLDTRNGEGCSKDTKNMLSGTENCEPGKKCVEKLKLDSNRIVDMFGCITTRTEMENVHFSTISNPPPKKRLSSTTLSSSGALTSTAFSNVPSSSFAVNVGSSSSSSSGASSIGYLVDPNFNELPQPFKRKASDVLYDDPVIVHVAGDDLNRMAVDEPPPSRKMCQVHDCGKFSQGITSSIVADYSTHHV